MGDSTTEKQRQVCFGHVFVPLPWQIERQAEVGKKRLPFALSAKLQAWQHDEMACLEDLLQR